MLGKRQELILKIIVQEYINRAVPVSSETIARGYSLGVSPATVRLDMAELEETGFITRPHASAGGVPSDKGYRYFVEHLEQVGEPSPWEQRMIQHLFHQVERDLESWLKLAATILARITGMAAVAVKPQVAAGRLKHVELIAVHQFRVLLILVLVGAKVKQKFLTFTEPISQEELNAITEKLNRAYAGLNYQQIKYAELPLSPLEEKVTWAIIQLMKEEESSFEEPYIYGLSNILSQPEFSRTSKVLRLMEAIEERDWLSSVIPEAPGVKVVIGSENRKEALQECSLVIGNYGIPGEVLGAIGVLGPTRMPYSQAISAVNYLNKLLSELVHELYE